MRIFWIRFQKYVLPVLFGIFMLATLWSLFFRNDPFATLLFYLLFDALFGTMLYYRVTKKALITFVLYVGLFSLLTVLSMVLVGGWVFMIVLLIDVPVAILAYQVYGDIY